MKKKTQKKLFRLESMERLVSVSKKEEQKQSWGITVNKNILCLTKSLIALVIELKIYTKNKNYDYNMICLLLCAQRPTRLNSHNQFSFTSTFTSYVRLWMWNGEAKFLYFMYVLLYIGVIWTQNKSFQISDYQIALF